MPSLHAPGPGVLGVETRNFAVLRQRMAQTAGTVVLADDGPADGPGLGFSETATVTAPGPHTVIAACVGIDHAQIFLSQSGGENHPIKLDVDCSGILSEVIVLQKGNVGAFLIRQDPTSAWKGAVAGIQITVQ